MGMAASQARYLALVARKSNCEYEGQQINQSRTVLSNQSANLFNQMLGLNVPVPPSTSDFTTKQYSFKSGNSVTVIDKWEQLATPEAEYNYVVTHHYYKDIYTGSQKQANDPQIQFTEGVDASVREIEQAIINATNAEKAYDEAKAARIDKQKEAATLKNYTNDTKFTNINNHKYYFTTNSYVISQKTESGEQTTIERDGTACNVFQTTDDNLCYEKDGSYYTLDNIKLNNVDPDFLKPYTDTLTEFIGYDKLTSEEDKAAVDTAIQKLIDKGALPEAIKKDLSGVYYDKNTKSIAFENDLKDLTSKNGTGSTILPIYNIGDGDDSIQNQINKYEAEISQRQLEEFTALQNKEAADLAYEKLKRPAYIGNSELTLLTTLTSDQEAALNQIVTDMKKNKIDTSITDCFGADGTYYGGVYEYKLNGQTYYTTFEELEKAYASGNGINHIDGQNALTYYSASYISTRIEETEKALLETDETGRFTSVRFENDSVTYPLNAETVTDEVAYQDAMNKFNYETAKYDKMIQDINAKTKIIQREDQQLELRLKQLDTEQNALSNEIEAVSKVVKDNIEKSFKTFGG